MRTRQLSAATFVLISSVCCAEAFVDPADQEPAAIIEIGGAADWSINDHVSSFGPSAAVEFTPIEEWLEIEAGFTPLFAHRSTEWDTDVLFKKPWTLSPKVEFMIGAGPEWIHTRANSISNESVGGEFALDFMFWPSAKHKLGWYLEPAYDYDFGRGHERSLGITAGLLIAIR